MKIKEIAASDITKTLKQQKLPNAFGKTTADDFFTKPRQWIAFLQSKGFKKLGTGSFALVMGKPGLPYVIKIPFKKDDAWYRFAEFCIENQNDKHIAKIKFLQKLTESGFFVSAIETLEKLEDRIPHRLAWILVDVIKRISPGGRYADNPSDSNNDLNNYIHEYLSRDFSTKDREYIWFMKILKPQLSALANTISRLATHDSNLDLHDGNMMFRGDTLVIVDPWYDWSDKYTGNKLQNVIWNIPKLKIKNNPTL